MNWLNLAVIGLTVLPIVIGLLLGLLRGSRRALLRLILVVVSLGLAFALCGVVGNALMNIKIPAGGEKTTLSDLLTKTLSQAMSGADLSTLALGLTKSIIKIITFLLLTFVFLFLTWAIVFPICKIFVKPRKKSDGTVKRHRLIGMVFGAVQGLIVGVFTCIVISGLFFQVGRIASAATNLADIGSNKEEQALVVQADEPFEDEEDEEPAESGSSAEMPSFFKMFAEYNDTSTAKFYDKIGGKLFEKLSQVKVDGKKNTLPGTVDAIDGVAKMANELMKLSDVDFVKMFENDADFETNFAQLQSILKELDNINGDLSGEARDTIMSVLGGLSDGMDMPVDLGSIDLEHIEFAKEADIISDLYGYSKRVDNITTEEAKDIVRDIADSNLALSALQNSGLNPDDYVPAEQKAGLADAIDELESEGEIDQSKLDAIRDLFNI